MTERGRNNALSGWRNYESPRFKHRRPYSMPEPETAQDISDRVQKIEKEKKQARRAEVEVQYATVEMGSTAIEQEIEVIETIEEAEQVADAA